MGFNDDNDAFDSENEDDGGADGWADMSYTEVIGHALRIAKEFKEQGLKLTLRQMYYQFVARGLAPNGDKVYKRLGAILTDARYDGGFPIDLLEDRGRDVHHGDFTQHCGTFENAVKGIPGFMHAAPYNLAATDQWYGQPAHVSVWVEKQALEGVFAGPCSELGVGHFSCKGYPSVSALYDWLRHTYFAVKGEHRDRRHGFRKERVSRWGGGHVEHHGHDAVERVVILYFGDHDPDGWQIPRSAEESLHKLMATYGLRIPLEFKRVALNMDQIERYNPPPFPAKMTSSRFKKYVAEHNTHDAWELDALNPATLRDLIRAEVGKLFVESIHKRNRAEVDALHAELRRRVTLTIDGKAPLLDAEAAKARISEHLEFLSELDPASDAVMHLRDVQDETESLLGDARERWSKEDEEGEDEDEDEDEDDSNDEEE